MVIVVEHVAVAALSLATHVTVRGVPSVKLSPDIVYDMAGAVQLSCAWAGDTCAVTPPHSKVLGAGQEMLGALSSTTLTGAEQEAVSPCESVHVSVATVVPSSKDVTLCTQPTRLPSGSIEPSLMEALTPPQEGPALRPTERQRATGGRFEGGGGAEPMRQDRGQEPKPLL
jgi:hypothetical protein